MGRPWVLSLGLLLAVEGGALAQGRPVQEQGHCTRAAPCIGPQGGVYFITPQGTRRYLPRSQAPSARVQENCTPASPCIGPRGGRYYISPSGTRQYLPRR
jgi:hypothetical protein